MQKYISADWIFPVVSEPLKNGVIGYLDDGEITAVLTSEQAEQQKITAIDYHQGAIVPGFINTHCHLELSHLYGKIGQHAGLTSFIKRVLATRQQPADEIILAMENADAEMYHNGIVAVGDISNQVISKDVKQKSKLYYQTFVEILGFNRPSKPIIEEALKIKNNFSPLKASIVPHAPYSVSADLFKEINGQVNVTDVLSIHNQETQDENELFETGTGNFATFFAELDIAQNVAHNTAQRSINYHLPKMSNVVNTLLVHNTFSSRADVDYANTIHQKLYWCLCPNANLFIENTLPNVQMLRESAIKITLGTDSLASNTQLNILAEMLTLQEQKQVPFAESLKWATLNSAEFLGISNQYGSLGIGKKPGLVLVDLGKDQEINNCDKITRLV